MKVQVYSTETPPPTTAHTHARARCDRVQRWWRTGPDSLQRRAEPRDQQLAERPVTARAGWGYGGCYCDLVVRVRGSGVLTPLGARPRSFFPGSPPVARSRRAARTLHAGGGASLWRAARFSDPRARAPFWFWIRSSGRAASSGAPVSVRTAPVEPHPSSSSLHVGPGDSDGVTSDPEDRRVTCPTTT